jgi:hypothetical protein
MVTRCREGVITALSTVAEDSVPAHVSLRDSWGETVANTVLGPISEKCRGARNAQ